MKIKSVSVNNHRKCFEVRAAKRNFILPFAKSGLVPSATDRVTSVYVDKEMAAEGITYVLKSGRQNSIPLDAFLDYNRDPEYLAKLLLHRLTLDALERCKTSKLSRRELARKLSTSPAQLYRLLDPANQTKTVDQMIKLLAALGYELEYKIVKEKSAA